MNIYEFADGLNEELTITRYPQQDNRFTADFGGGEVKDGGMLVSRYGEGQSPVEALNDYAAQISGKTLVFDAYGDARREHLVPALEKILCDCKG
jgi:hypothetical protein